MKKIMMADLIKDISNSYLEERALRIKELTDQFNITKDDATNIVDNYSDYDTQDLIATAMEAYDLNLGEAEMFVDDHPNESTWADYESAAEELGVDITDVNDDDVEAINSGGGAKGEIESSSGPIRYKYILGIGYMVHLMLNGKDIMYQNIDPQTMSDWINADSAGNYYLDNIRSNVRDDQELCGCNANLCEPTDIAQINS
jgi:hypothetical protein